MWNPHYEPGSKPTADGRHAEADSKETCDTWKGESSDSDHEDIPYDIPLQADVLTEFKEELPEVEYISEAKQERPEKPQCLNLDAPPSLVCKQLVYRQRRPSIPEESECGSHCLGSRTPSKLSRPSEVLGEQQVHQEVLEALNEHQQLVTARLDALMERQQEVLDRLNPRETHGRPASPGHASPAGSTTAGMSIKPCRRAISPRRAASRGVSSSDIVPSLGDVSLSGPLTRMYRPSIARSRMSFSDLSEKIKWDMGCASHSPSNQSRPPSDATTTRSILTNLKETVWGESRHQKQLTLDVVASIMICGNALLIGIETEYMTHNQGVSSKGFVLAQLILNVWFMFEFFFRLSIDKFRFFTPSDWKWNLFDGIMVCVSIADVVHVSEVGLDGGGMIHGRLMRMVRLSRVIRTLRVARALSYIHQFRKMVYSLQTSMSTLVWSLLLLCGVMYAFAVLFVQGVAEYAVDPTADSAQVSVLQDHYGSLLSAYITLYKAISNGASWGLLMEPLEAVDGTFLALFLAYISIVFFGVLNVVSAIFVESAMASTSHYKDLRIYESRKAKSELVRHMKEVFKQIDKDMSGEISFEEMDHFLTDPQLKNYVESLEVTVEDTAMLFRLMDLDDSGVVDIDEFCAGLLRLQGDARSFDVHLMMFEIKKFLKRWGRFETDIENMISAVVDHVSTTVAGGDKQDATCLASWPIASFH